MSTSQQLFRRLLSFAVSFIALTICLPFLPLIILAVRFSFARTHFFQPDARWTARAFVYCLQVPHHAEGL